jgi:hypothetical protein
LKEFKEEHGEEDAPKRKDYKKYDRKRDEYLEILEHTTQWKDKTNVRTEIQRTIVSSQRTIVSSLITEVEELILRGMQIL